MTFLQKKERRNKCEKVCEQIDRIRHMDATVNYDWNCKISARDISLPVE